MAYGANSASDTSLRIIADHLKTACFILGDAKGVAPSNVGAGYVLRRLIRRAIRHGRKLGIEGSFLHVPANAIFEIYRAAYPELAEKRDFILTRTRRRGRTILETLSKGEHGDSADASRPSQKSIQDHRWASGF